MGANGGIIGLCRDNFASGLQVYPQFVYFVHIYGFDARLFHRPHLSKPLTYAHPYY